MFFSIRLARCPREMAELFRYTREEVGLKEREATKSLQTVNDKVSELFNDKVLILSYLVRTSSNLLKPKKKSNFRLLDDTISY